MDWLVRWEQFPGEEIPHLQPHSPLPWPLGPSWVLFGGFWEGPVGEAAGSRAVTLTVSIDASRQVRFILPACLYFCSQLILNSGGAKF